MLKSLIVAAGCGMVSAWHPSWLSEKPSWYKEEEETQAAFPLYPKQLNAIDYMWLKRDQKLQVETTDGTTDHAVYFRPYIPQEVFASQLAEYLGLCVARSRYIPHSSKVSHAWQDLIQDVTQHITTDNVARAQYLFENQAGVQEIEFIDGARVEGYQAVHGYAGFLVDIGKLMAFDVFINDGQNCRFSSNDTNGHDWTCNAYNFIASPSRGVCANSRAYGRLDINSPEGLKFREFFQLAHSQETDTELARKLGFIAGDIFGDHLTMDRREATAYLLKGAKFTLDRIQEAGATVFDDVSKTAGMHSSFENGLSDRLRMINIIRQKQSSTADKKPRFVSKQSLTPQ